MAIEIVDFPIKNGDFPYVKLPEGTISFFFEGDSLKYTTPNRFILTFDDWANEGFLTGETPQQSK